MAHVQSLIFDLSVILITAGIISFIFKRMNQPLVLGYILAGVLAGPYLGLMPVDLLDIEDIKIWADIGVIFLLFALGLDFSFRKLKKVGDTAIIATIIEVSCMFILGFVVGYLMGWSKINCIFLGSMMCISSTSIIIKSFSDLNVKKEKFVNIVFGILIVEDLVAVLILVLLSTLSSGKDINGLEVLFNISRLIFFLIVWFVTGVFIIPSLLKKGEKWLNDETLLIFSVGLCLTMVVIAIKTGFSSALGAFIMGSILGESVLIDRIRKLIKPIENLFGAIFFVSVGMMLDPHIVFQYWTQILFITIAIIFGKIFFPALGILISGRKIEVALRSSFSMAQVGEFAFIIAGLGVSLGVTASYLYPIIISVSVITAFTTPYLMKLSNPFLLFLRKRVPLNIQKKVDSLSFIKDDDDIYEWRKLIRSYLLYMIFLIIICIAIIFLFSKFLYPLALQNISFFVSNLIVMFLTLLFVSPFLRAMISFRGDASTVLMNLLMRENSNKTLLGILAGIRFLVVYIFILFIVNKYFYVPLVVNVFISIALLYIIFHSKWLLKSYWKIQSRFIINLNERQVYLNEKKIIENEGVHNLSEISSNHWLDYKLYTCVYQIGEGSFFADKKLNQLNLRNDYNLNVVRVMYDGKYENIPSGECLIKEGMCVCFAGKPKYVHGIRSNANLKLKFINNSYMTLHSFSQIEYKKRSQNDRINCSGIPVVEENKEKLTTLKDSKIGLTKCLVIGVERGLKQYVNPAADFALKKDDLVWVLGKEKAVSELIEINLFKK